jgi:DNA polymerase-3 subunit delta
LVKGLKHPDWPLEPWAGLRRLALMVCEQVAASGARPQGMNKLALQARPSLKA